MHLWQQDGISQSLTLHDVGGSRCSEYFRCLENILGIATATQRATVSCRNLDFLDDRIDYILDFLNAQVLIAPEFLNIGFLE